MADYQTGYVIGFHGCDRELGLRLINGQDELKPSDNDWDWLGPGVYFWEQDPSRALNYALEAASGEQRNKTAPKTPFVVGTIIELGNCLNLVDSEGMSLLKEAYEGLKEIKAEAKQPMPVNKGKHRALDCAVIRYIHSVNKDSGVVAYDTVRCAFPEGDPVYPDSMFTSQLHIQISVLNTACIKGYFLPKPIDQYNPYLSSI